MFVLSQSPARALSLSPARALSLFPLARSRSLSLARSRCLPLACSRSLSLARSRSLPLARSRCLPLARSRCFPLACSRSLSLARSRCLPLARSRSLSLARSRCFPLARSRSLSLARSRCLPARALSQSPARALSLFPARALSQSLARALSLSPASCSRSLSLARTRSLPLARSRCLPLARSRCFPLARSRSLSLARSRCFPLARSRSLPLARSRCFPLARSRSLPLARSRCSLARALSQSPARALSLFPARVLSQSLARALSQSLARALSLSLARALSLFPARALSQSPARALSLFPARVLSQSPARALSLSPARVLSQSLARALSQSPACVLSQSPACALSQSPARALSLFPARVLSQSPARALSLSPARALSQSPARALSLFAARMLSQSLARALSRFPLACSRSLPLARSRSLSLARSRCLPLARSRGLPLACSRSLSLACSRSLSLARSRCFPLACSRSLSLARSRSLPLARSRCLQLARSRCFPLARSRSHSLARSRCFPLACSRCLSLARSRSLPLARSRCFPLVCSRCFPLARSRCLSLARPRGLPLRLVGIHPNPGPGVTPPRAEVGSDEPLLLSLLRARLCVGDEVSYEACQGGGAWQSYRCVVVAQGDGPLRVRHFARNACWDGYLPQAGWAYRDVVAGSARSKRDRGGRRVRVATFSWLFLPLLAAVEKSAGRGALPPRMSPDAAIARLMPVLPSAAAVFAEAAVDLVAHVRLPLQWDGGYLSAQEQERALYPGGDQSAPFARLLEAAVAVSLAPLGQISSQSSGELGGREGPAQALSRRRSHERRRDEAGARTPKSRRRRDHDGRAVLDSNQPAPCEHGSQTPTDERQLTPALSPATGTHSAGPAPTSAPLASPDARSASERRLCEPGDQAVPQFSSEVSARGQPASPTPARACQPAGDAPYAPQDNPSGGSEVAPLIPPQSSGEPCDGTPAGGAISQQPPSCEQDHPARGMPVPAERGGREVIGQPAIGPGAEAAARGISPPCTISPCPADSHCDAAPAAEARSRHLPLALLPADATPPAERSPAAGIDAPSPYPLANPQSGTPAPAPRPAHLTLSRTWTQPATSARLRGRSVPSCSALHGTTARPRSCHGSRAGQRSAGEQVPPGNCQAMPTQEVARPLLQVAEHSVEASASGLRREDRVPSVAEVPSPTQVPEAPEMNASPRKRCRHDVGSHVEPGLPDLRGAHQELDEPPASPAQSQAGPRMDAPAGAPAAVQPGNPESSGAGEPQCTCGKPQGVQGRHRIGCPRSASTSRLVATPQQTPRTTFAVENLSKLPSWESLATADVPLLQHVPRKAAAAVADSLAATLRRVSVGAEPTWRALYAFPKMILGRVDGNAAPTVRRRCAMWSRGDFEELWAARPQPRARAQTEGFPVIDASAMPPASRWDTGETAARLARTVSARWLAEHRSDSCVLKIDFTNAFNEHNRQHMLSEVAAAFPDALWYAVAAYQTPSRQVPGGEPCSSPGKGRTQERLGP